MNAQFGFRNRIGRKATRPVQRGVLMRSGVSPRSSWRDTLIIGLDWPRTVASETTQCRCVVQPAAPVDRVSLCITLVARSGSAALTDQIIEHRYRRQHDQDRCERDRGDEAKLLEAEGASQPAGKEHPE
jgi:hypothetical protein